MNRVEMIAITGHTAKKWPATDPSFQARRKSSFRRQNSRGLSADMQLPLGAAVRQDQPYVIVVRHLKANSHVSEFPLRLLGIDHRDHSARGSSKAQ